MFYFLKWLAKQWAEKITKVLSITNLGSMYFRLLDSIGYGFCTYFILVIFTFIIGMAQLLYSKDITFIGVMVWSVVQLCLYLSVKFREYQKEKQEILNKLND